MPTSPPTPPRKARNSQPRYYCVTGLNPEDTGPTLVKAKTQADVLDHLLKITLATPEDLIQAGIGGWTVIDLVNPTAPIKFGSETKGTEKAP
jgi:hypothetical protein